MARGAAGAAQSNLGTTNAIGAQNNSEAQALQSQLAPTYTSMLNMGETPQQQEAATNNGMGSVASAYGNAAQTATNTAARTNNASGLTAAQDELAMNKGVAGANEANNLQTQNNQVLQANRAEGLNGLMGLESGDQAQTAQMYGLGPSTINAWSNAQNNNPGMKFASQLIGAAGAAAS